MMVAVAIGLGAVGVVGATLFVYWLAVEQWPGHRMPQRTRLGRITAWVIHGYPDDDRPALF